MSRPETALPSWLDTAVDLVAEQIAARPADSERDIYVWDDGSVTGPKDPDSGVAERRLVAEFSPNETPDRAAIRLSLENGLRTVPRD